MPRMNEGMNDTKYVLCPLFFLPLEGGCLRALSIYAPTLVPPPSLTWVSSLVPLLPPRPPKDLVTIQLLTLKASTGFLSPLESVPSGSPGITGPSVICPLSDTTFYSYPHSYGSLPATLALPDRFQNASNIPASGSLH